MSFFVITQRSRALNSRMSRSRCSFAMIEAAERDDEAKTAAATALVDAFPELVGDLRETARLRELAETVLERIRTMLAAGTIRPTQVAVIRGKDLVCEGRHPGGKAVRTLAKWVTPRAADTLY